MFPLPFAPSRLGLYALAGILAVLLVVAGWLAIDTSGKLRAATRQVASVTQERDKAREDLGACQVNRQTLTAGIESQNAAFERMRREAEIAQAEGDKHLQAALRTAQTYKARAERLSHARPASGDLCASARGLITETLEQERAQ